MEVTFKFIVEYHVGNYVGLSELSCYTNQVSV